MRRFMTGAATLLFAASLIQAGEKSPAFTKAWETTVSGDVKNIYTTTDNQFQFGIGKKTLTSISGSDGKIVGTAQISELLGGKGIDDWMTVSGEGCHYLLAIPEGRGDVKNVSAIDLATVKTVWSTSLLKPDLGSSVYLADLKAVAIPIEDTLVLIDAASGKTIWQKPKFFGKIMRNIYLADEKTLLTVSYLPGGARSFAAAFTFGRTQVSCINVETGATVWENTYKMVNATLGSNAYQKDYVSIAVDNGQLFLTLDYLRMINLKTGADLWTGRVANDISFSGTYALEAQQLPLPAGGFIYQTNFNHDVFKTDRNTGADAWKSEIPKSVYLPKLLVTDKNVIVQRGGYICKEQPIKLQTGFLVGYKREWETNGPYGITALDINTGAKVWATEKFKGGLTRLILDNGLIYCCSGDSFYCINAADGAAKYAVPHKDAKLGETRWAFDGGDKVAVICEKGLCAYSKADGKRVWTTPVKNVADYLVQGTNFFLINDDKVYTGVDIASGAIKGTIESEDYTFQINNDGEQIIAIKDKVIDKYLVNKK
jgi:hypothetical protein